MSRSYKKVRLKKHRVYTVRDLMVAFSITENTISNWVKAGLNPSDSSKPYVFLGDVVNHFHDFRRAKTRINLCPGEFKCTGCKMAVIPDHFFVALKPSCSGAPILHAECPECSANLFKFGSDADLAALGKDSNPNTSKGSSHERVRSAPGEIGIEPLKSGSKNDRIIWAWQSFAEKHSDKTVDRHLAAIRYLDDALAQKLFSQLTTQCIGEVRNRLKATLSATDRTRRSKSTVSHIASHLRAFLEWLIRQDDHNHLPRDLPDYLELPKSVYSASLPRDQKLYPTLEEAAELLKLMPSQTLAQKRNRAIFAIAFLGTLRADTLISLLIKHVDITNRTVVQDGTVSRTKNGKSLVTGWFPMPEIFEKEVISWIGLLMETGFGAEDALFPDMRNLGDFSKHQKDGRAPVAPMKSKYAVTEAFSRACQNQTVQYSPHSAKHTIAAERDKRPLTSLQRKAWSENMGHETEQITDRHYGKMSDGRKLEVLETIEDNLASTTRRILSDEEKIALVDAVLDKASLV